MLTSEGINEIAGALAKAQAAIQNPKKESENPHFKSRYADLATGIDAVRLALAAQAIVVVQATSMDGDMMMLETRLVHSSGQWFGSIYPVCKFPARQQEIGSALTFSRRYSLFALAGIAGDDDDGNEASKVETPAPKVKPRTSPPAREAIDPEESRQAREQIVATLDDCETLSDFDAWGQANKSKIDSLRGNDIELVRTAFSTRRHAAKVAAEQKDVA